MEMYPGIIISQKTNLSQISVDFINMVLQPRTTKRKKMNITRGLKNRPNANKTLENNEP